MYLKQKQLRLTQRGIGLPATVFLIVILSLIVLAMSELNESSALSFGQDLNATKAFYAAESGAQVAMNRHFVGGIACSAISGSSINFTAEGLTSCSTQLTCSDVTVGGIDYLTFTSTATCGGGFESATRSVQVRAHEP